jgi:hypothetical protein
VRVVVERGDQIRQGELDVVDAEYIAETAFVLPCIENVKNKFPLQMKDAKYYHIMPPRSEWKNIGW